MLRVSSVRKEGETGDVLVDVNQGRADNPTEGKTVAMQRKSNLLKFGALPKTKSQGGSMSIFNCWFLLFMLLTI